jgi:hypothetical protein
MAPEKGKSKHVGLSIEELDVIDNKVSMALARHEEIVKGWMKASNITPKPPVKTEDEIEAQIIGNSGGGINSSRSLKAPVGLGDKSLHARLLPSKTLKASKRRDAEEKAASAKRALKEESSDEEEGRSGLGKAKKPKSKPRIPEPVKPVHVKHEDRDLGGRLSANGDSKKVQNDINGSPAQDGTSTLEQSKKRKAQAILEEAVKKTKLEEKTIITEQESKPQEGREDDMDIDAESNANEQKPEPGMVAEKNGTVDPNEAKRLKKKLKRERKKKRLQAEAEAATSASKA